MLKIKRIIIEFDDDTKQEMWITNKEIKKGDEKGESK